jgi:hypothetical protein
VKNSEEYKNIRDIIVENKVVKDNSRLSLARLRKKAEHFIIVDNHLYFRGIDNLHLKVFAQTNICAMKLEMQNFT